MDVFAHVGGAAQRWGLESYYTKEQFPELSKIYMQEDLNDQKTREWHNMCLESCPMFNLSALKAFYERRWFSRLWTVQEFCLGDHAVFVCGEKRVMVDLVFLALQVLELGYTSTLKFHDPAERVQRIKELRHAKSNDPASPLFSARNRRLNYHGESLYKILQRLYDTQHKEASNPRDRIFGLLALANDSEELGIQPDYTATVEMVYRRAARAIIQSGEIDLLSLAQFPKFMTRKRLLGFHRGSRTGEQISNHRSVV